MAIRDELQDFLLDLSDFYPIEAKRKDNVISQAVEFLLQYCLDHKIDWKKAKNEVFEAYTYKSFPDLALLRDSIKNSYIYETNIAKDEGGLMLVILPDGYIYEFVITNFGQNIEALKKRVYDRYGNCRVKIFPAGSTLIGKKVFLPDDRVIEIGA